MKAKWSCLCFGSNVKSVYTQTWFRRGRRFSLNVGRDLSGNKVIAAHTEHQKNIQVHSKCLWLVARPSY